MRDDDPLTSVTEHLGSALAALGATQASDPELADTARRFARLLHHRFRPDAPRHRLEPLPLESPPTGPVVLRDLPFHALCVHHVVPFFGHVHLYFVPGRSLVGFGAVGRLVDSLCARPQLQERLTDQLAQAIMDDLAPRHVVVASEARQMCMELTGACKTGTTISVAGRGVGSNAERDWEIARQLLRNTR